VSKSLFNITNYRRSQKSTRRKQATMSLVLVVTIVQVVSLSSYSLIGLLRKTSQQPTAKEGALVMGGA
jgi:beta-lactamase regulating signal transducer with metallopeptidase domain